MNPYTTADLLQAVKNIGMLPDASSGSLSPDNLLVHATDELHGTIVPMILAAREHFYETYSDLTVSADKMTYPIPNRAIGGLLSSVQYIYGLNIIGLNPIQPTNASTTWSSLSPRGYWFENNNIVLYPTPSSPNYIIRMRYFQRPSRLTQVSNCGQIVSIDNVGQTVTLSSIPTSWTPGIVVDFVPTLLPNTPYGIDSSVTGISGTVVSFSTLPATVAVGDWLAIAGYTPIPELPYEMFASLAQATVCKALESIGDAQGLATAGENFKIKISNALKLITPRDQTGPKRVCSNWRNL